jgi:hypothetical protein
MRPDSLAWLEADEDGALADGDLPLIHMEE